MIVEVGGSSSAKPIKIEIQGATPDDIKASVERLGKLPASAVSSPARKSATKVKQVAKRYAPRKTGTLQRGIVVRPKKEHTSIRGKAVYDVWMDSGMNSVFVKTSASGKRAYYPASMEYGFSTVNGGRVDGRHYLRTAAEEMSGIHEQLVLDEVYAKLEALWEKQQGGSNK